MMLLKHQEQIDKLRANNPSFNDLLKEYEAAESEKLKRELENKINEILIKIK
jgi:hypothetical protein